MGSPETYFQFGSLPPDQKYSAFPLHGINSGAHQFTGEIVALSGLPSFLLEQNTSETFCNARAMLSVRASVCQGPASKSTANCTALPSLQLLPNGQLIPQICRVSLRGIHTLVWLLVATMLPSPL